MNGAFHSGFAALLGRPNAGKSTLLNALLGEKMAIVSAKPQTTRRQIRGILTGEHSQIVFVDTPGYHDAKEPLNQAMVEQALSAAADADVVLYLLDATRGITAEDQSATGYLKGLLNQKKDLPVFCVVSKIDRVAKPQLLPLLEKIVALLPWKEIVPVSALQNDGLDVLLKVIRNSLPEGPAYFPEDQISDLTERFRAAETVREKLFERLDQELPYSVAVEIDAFEEKDGLNRVRAKIHVERDSQKAIVIGKGGALLKEIGTAARKELEGLWGKKVFLELLVDVEKDWSRDPKALRRFGYLPADR